MADVLIFFQEVLQNATTNNLSEMKSNWSFFIHYFQAKDVKVCEAEFNPEFIARVIPRLDWSVIVKAATELGHASDLPSDLAENYENDQDFLKKVHHVLMEIDIINGDLVCPETGRKFPVSDGIPNMLLNEDEV